MSNGETVWRRVFGLDVRSLAVLRIGLGLVLLGNLCDLTPDIGAFFSDEGLLPRTARMQLNASEVATAPPHWCSLHMLSGATWCQELLIGAAIVLSGCVVLGYRTSWALFGSWILLVGLQARNPLILIGGDDVLRCLLFWCLFLPLGACWSLDARRTGPPPQRTICNAASAALLIQLACIYVFSGLLKSDPPWRSEFTALYLALSGDHHTTRLGLALLDYPRLLQVLTLATLVLEMAGPLALFMPWRTARLRMAVIASFWGLHLGILATMDVGIFSPICMVYWTALLPAAFWDSPFLRNGLSRSCVPLVESEPTASAPTAGGLSVLFAPALIALLVSYVLLLNVARLASQNLETRLTPSPVQILGDAAQLDQFWCMFAPRPFEYGGWINVNGTLANGELVNLWQPELPVQDSRPPVVSEVYRNMRWRKVMVNLFERDCPTHTQGVDAYLRRRWNDTHPSERQIEAVEAILVKELILLPGQGTSRGQPELEVLWRSSRTRSDGWTALPQPPR